MLEEHTHAHVCANTFEEHQNGENEKTRSSTCEAYFPANV
jgi:hypothetical protein